MPPAVLDEQVEVRELELLDIRADVVPKSWNEEKRTVRVRWTAGADVKRYDWTTGQRYWERLDFSAGAIMLERLNSGRAAVLDAHSSWSSRDVVGVVEGGSVEIDSAARTGDATLRFTTAADAEPVVTRVKEGVLASFSFGYKCHRIEQTGEQRDGLPVWIVRKWEPFEISPVPIPADAGAGARAEPEPSKTKYPCEIVRRSSPPMPPEITTPTAPTEAERKAAQDKADAERKAATDEATRAERERAKTIRGIIAKAKQLDEAKRAELVAQLVDGDKPATVDQARAAVLDAIAAVDEAKDTRGQFGVGATDDEKIRGELFDGCMLRQGRTVKTPGDLAKSFRHMRAGKIAEFFLRRAGIDTTLLSDVEIARRAMSTSDFPQALANVQGKTLRQAYQEAPRTFEPFVRRTSLNDFKPASRIAMSGSPGLVKVVEGAGIPNGKIGDIAQGIRVFKYGTVLAFTWESLVNDELDALLRESLMFGASVASLEGDLVYGIITGNQVMDEDSVAMIHSSHGNTTTGVLSVAALATARGKLRKMVGPAPTSRALNLEGRLILTGPDLEIEASKYVADITPEQAGNANPLRDKIRGVIADTRLPATKWWMTATPDQNDTIELANLAGVEDIMVDSEVNFRTKSLETSALAHRGASAIDHRWIVESTGA